MDWIEMFLRIGGSSAGGATADMLASGEGVSLISAIFSGIARFLGIADTTLNMAGNISILSARVQGDDPGAQLLRSVWAKLTGDERQSLTGAEGAIDGIGILMRELAAHKGDQSAAELLQRLGEWNAALPSVPQVEAVINRLSTLLDPSRANYAALMRELEDARKALIDPVGRAAYERLWQDNPNALKETIEMLGNLPVAPEHTVAPLALTGDTEIYTEAAKTCTGARKWFEDLKPTQKGLLVFGVVATVGAGVYLAANFFENRRKKHLQRKLAAMEEHGKDKLDLLPDRKQESRGRHRQDPQAAAGMSY